MKNNPRFEAILMDADGVIQFNKDFRTSVTEVLGEHVTLAEAQALEVSALTDETDLAADLDALLAERGSSRTGAEVLDVWKVTHPIPEVLDVIDRVRATGVPVYLATNQHRVRGTHMRETLGYENHFDEQFHSFELGLAKPSPDFFHAIIDRIGADPARVLFVDDVVENVEGARQAGLVAEHHPRDADVDHLIGIFQHHGLLD